MLMSVLLECARGCMSGQLRIWIFLILLRVYVWCLIYV
jgi:hypothetical protein